ncbi:MAG: hypothetical protein Faunusvirus4_8 [Faunusvirus sp.]|jgi:hypothetical protein|uniref:Ankyrin repeat protein n=1 Tax=Faunusvirus sp. TaxID=2487766 RepID=A0A3G4ZW91_9VIRU|nr:MAG: hypothetical protein Faunusvirus4_8 [Faunusvirus sp.]
MGLKLSVNSKNINKQHSDGNTNLMLYTTAWYSSRNRTIILKLVEKYHDQIDFNLQNNMGETLLMRACNCMDIKLANFILAHKNVDIKLCDKKGRSLLYYTRTPVWFTQLAKNGQFDKITNYKLLTDYFVAIRRYSMVVTVIEYKKIVLDNYADLYRQSCEDGSEYFATYIYEHYYKQHNISPVEYLTISALAQRFKTLRVSINLDMTAEVPSSDMKIINKTLENYILYKKPPVRKEVDSIVYDTYLPYY